MGGPLRGKISISSYEFHEIKKFGDSNRIKIEENCLFLELTTIPPESDNVFQMWKRYCESRRFPYLIAEGVIKSDAQKALLLNKAKQMGKTADEIIEKKYSYGLPEKVYGFFRTKIDVPFSIGKEGLEEHSVYVK